MFILVAQVKSAWLTMSKAARERLSHSEVEVLNAGIDWYAEWRDKPVTPCSFEATDIRLPGLEKQRVHQVRYFRGPPSARPYALSQEAGAPLVLLHGLGGGIGTFAAVLPVLRDSWKGPLFALDMFGCCLSSRPDFAFGHGSDKDREGAQRFFTEPLEQWRKAVGLGQLIICGHSMGGFVATCYARHYPQSVDRLILASCAGLYHQPEDDRSDCCMALWDNQMEFFKCCVGIPCLGKMIMRNFFTSFRDASWLDKTLEAEYLHGSLTCGKASGLKMGEVLLSSSGDNPYPLDDFFGNLQVRFVSLVFACDEENLDAGKHTMQALAASGVRHELLLIDDGVGAHEFMFSNPVGFAEAILASGSGLSNGQTFGTGALEREFGEQ